MDNLKQAIADNLQRLAAKASSGAINAVFAVGIAEDGPTQTVYVEPEDRESLIIAINEELTRMLGSPHHVVSLEKLQDFCAVHKITDSDLINFQIMQEGK